MPLLSTGTEHALNVSGSGELDVTPFSRLLGTATVPFTNSCHATADVTLVPAGAPAVVKYPGRPAVSHFTLSCALHAARSRSRSC